MRVINHIKRDGEMLLNNQDPNHSSHHTVLRMGLHHTQMLLHTTRHLLKRQVLMENNQWDQLRVLNMQVPKSEVQLQLINLDKDSAPEELKDSLVYRSNSRLWMMITLDTLI